MTENRPSRRKGQAAAADGLELWHRLTRDIAPLPRRKPLDRDRPGRIVRAGETPAVPSPPAIVPPPRPPKPSVPDSPGPPMDRFAGIDRANAERLKRGKRAIEARLD